MSFTGRASRSVRLAAAPLLALALAAAAAGASGARAASPSQAGADLEVTAVVLEAEDRRLVSADLRGLLQSADPAVRSRATLALGRIGVPAVVPALLERLDDEQSGVRATAAFALGRVEYDLALRRSSPLRHEAREALASRLDDAAPEVRAAAARALGFVGGSAVPVETALAQLAGETVPTNPDVTAALLESWWRLEERAVEYVRPFVGSPDPTVRLAAAAALAESSDPNAQPSLVALLRDPEAEVRLMALRGLAAGPGPLAARYGAELFRDGDWRVQSMALDWMGASWAGSGGAGVDDDLFMAVLRRTLDRNLHVRRAALAALGAPARHRAVALDRLLEGLAEPEQAVRMAALTGLRGAGPDAANATLRRLAERHPDLFEAGPFASLPDSPGEAALIVSLLASRSPAAALVEAGRGPGKARVIAARELERLDRAEAARLAVAWLDDPDPDLRTAAVEMLGRASLGAEGELTERLWRSYHDDRTVGRRAYRVAAFTTMLELEPELMVRRLALLLDEPDRVLRLRAVRALSEERELLERLEATPELLQGHVTGRSRADYLEMAGRVRDFQESPPRLLIPTTRGEILVQLDVASAPLSVLQIVELAQTGRFDGSRFDRVVSGAWAQGGRPDAREATRLPLRSEESPLVFVAGTVAVAASGRDTGTSELLIGIAAQPHRRGEATVVGEVVEGQRAAGRLQPGDPMTIEVQR